MLQGKVRMAIAPWESWMKDGIQSGIGVGSLTAPDPGGFRSSEVGVVWGTSSSMLEYLSSLVT